MKIDVRSFALTALQKWKEGTLKEKIGKVRFPGWLFLVLTVLYNEGLLCLWTADSLNPWRVLTIFAFSIGFGAALALLDSFLPSPKAAKWVAVGLAAAINVLWLTEFFLKDAFNGFRGLADIFSNADGVAAGFMQDVLSAVVSGFWRIVLMLLPTVLYALFSCPGKADWKLRRLLAASCVGAYLLGVGTAVMAGDYNRFHKTYELPSAVNCFGLSVALELDIYHGSSEEKPVAFSTVSDAPPRATTPAQEAQTVPTPEDSQPAPTYGENKLEALDFGTLEESAKIPAVASLYGYLNTLQPSAQNAYTGLFEGKNLILITAEAFTEQVIDPERTPTLYRLAHKGIFFSDYYQPAWGSGTTGGEFSNLTGLAPTNAGMCMKEAIQQDLFLTMGHQLQKLGYYSVAYHNNNADFYDRNKTHTHLGYDQFLAQYGGLEGITPVWPESDLEMIDVTVPQYIDQQPFSVYYMTVSGHSVYSLSANAMAQKHYEEVEDMDCAETVKCYYAAQLELEAAMESLVRQLEEAGIADDTVIVLSTDHYPYGLERSGTWRNTSDYLAELYGVDKYDRFIRDHNALIIWSGCLEDKGVQIDEPVYSLDILPTLSNLFGLEYDSRLLVGRDIFSGTAPLVLWMDYSWKTDKGQYDSQTGIFTPAPGVTVDDGYVDSVSDIVADKINYCRSVLNTDFFNYVSEALGRGE